MWILLCVGCVLSAFSLPAQESKSGKVGEPMRMEKSQGERLPVIYADRKEISEEVMRAFGHVEIVWDEYHIYADTVEYNLKTKTVTAQGRVTMASGDTVLSGTQLRFDLKTMSGDMDDTFGLMSPFVKYETDHLQQTDRHTIRFKRLSLTSCTQTVPRWRITCRKGKIKKDRYIDMKNVVLRVKNIPIFYWPFLRYPVRKDGRATGFLFPQVGDSDLRGFFLLNSFFWNIRSNFDLTLTAEYYEKMGLGGGAELRYLFPNATGDLRYYHFVYNEKCTLGSGNASDYFIDAGHSQNFGFLNSRAVVNVRYPSYPGFLRLFDNNIDRFVVSNYQSTFFWDSSWRNFSFSLDATRNETYYITKNSSNVIQRLPAAELRVDQQKIWKIPGYFSLSGEFQNAVRKGVSYEDEPEFAKDFRSQRWTLAPSYTLSLFQLPWLTSTVDLASRHSFYSKSIDPKTKKTVAVPVQTNYQTCELTLSGPFFYRVYEGKGVRFKHVLEPQLSFRYASKVENRNRVVRVDYSDYPSYSYAGFSLTSRLFMKRRQGEQLPLEVFTYSIEQSYFLDPAEANFFLKINGEYPEFSELTNRLRLRPDEFFSLDLAASYNYYMHTFSRLNVGVTLAKPGGALTGSFMYNSYKYPYGASVYNRDILRSDLRLAIPRFPLQVAAGVDYDFTDRVFRYGSLMAILDYQCVTVALEYKVFQFLLRTENQFRISFTLGDLGMVSDFLGRNR